MVRTARVIIFSIKVKPFSFEVFKLLIESQLVAILPEELTVIEME